MNVSQFRNLFAILIGIDKDELEKADIIKPGANGGTDWTRFNDDLPMFVLKMTPEKRQKLLDLCERRNGGKFA